MIIKKRQLMLATLVAVLAAAVFVNWYYTRPQAETAQSSEVLTTLTPLERDGSNLGDARYVISSDVTVTNTEENEFFSNAKQRRLTTRDEALEALNDIIKDPSSSPDAVAKASESLERIADSVTVESDLESLIFAKVGCENLAILNGGKAEIIVENGFLDDAAVIKIKETVMNHTGYPAENITIVEMKY